MSISKDFLLLHQIFKNWYNLPMLTIFLKVLVIFLMAAIGYIASKTGTLPREANPYMVDLLMNITCPAMILSGMTSVTLTAAAKVHVAQVMIGSLVFFGAGMAIAYFLVKAMGYDPAEDRGVLMVLICSCNTGFMGFPVTRSIFGDYFFFLLVMENVILNVYLFILVPWQMTFGTGTAVEGGSASARTARFLRSMVNPNNVCVVLGLIFLFGRIPLPGPLSEMVNMIGDATVPISMIVIGLQLAERPLSELFTNGRLVICCLMNVILVPFLTFLAVNWLPLAPESKLILIFAACFPAAVIPVALASKQGKNATLMAQGVSLSTLLSMATLPLAATLLMNLYV